MVITQHISYILVYYKGLWVWICPRNENVKEKKKNYRQDK